MCHDILSGAGQLPKKIRYRRGYIMEKLNSDEYLKEQERQKIVNGLKRFQAKGIKVLIDGEKPGDEDWDKIFVVREDGSFYMSDYVGMEEGALREIHFDRVYYR